jgi:hypothetical protein
MMPKPVWLKPKEDLLGRGEDKWVDLSQKKKPVYDEETEELVESPKSEPKSEPAKHQTKHEPSDQASPIPQTKHEEVKSAGHRFSSKSRQLGGVNRALLLSKQERSEIASKGAQARWMKAKGGQSN